MNFARTVAALESGEAALEFARELTANRRELPLDAQCLAGGVLDPGSIEITGVHLEDSTAEIGARCTIYFDEISRGGCADTLIREERSMTVALFIDKKTARAYLTDAG